MRAEVRAVTPDAFEVWAEEQRTAIDEGGATLAEQRDRREREEGDWWNHARRLRSRHVPKSSCTGSSPSLAAGLRGIP